MAGPGGDLSTELERADRVCYMSQLLSRSLNIELDEINLFLKLMSIRIDTKVNNRRMHKRDKAGSLAPHISTWPPQSEI